MNADKSGVSVSIAMLQCTAPGQLLLTRSQPIVGQVRGSQQWAGSVHLKHSRPLGGEKLLIYQSLCTGVIKVNGAPNG
jgi:hypothetical protein